MKIRKGKPIKKPFFRVRFGSGEMGDKSFVYSVTQNGSILVEFDDEIYCVPIQEIIKEVARFKGLDN